MANSTIVAMRIIDRICKCVAGSEKAEVYDVTVLNLNYKDEADVYKKVSAEIRFTFSGRLDNQEMLIVGASIIFTLARQSNTWVLKPGNEIVFMPNTALEEGYIGLVPVCPGDKVRIGDGLFAQRAKVYRKWLNT